MDRKVTVNQIRSRLIIEDIERKLDELESIQNNEDQWVISDESEAIRADLNSLRERTKHLNNILGY